MRRVTTYLILAILPCFLFSQNTPAPAETSQLQLLKVIESIRDMPASPKTDIKDRGYKYNPKVIPNFGNDAIMPMPFADQAEPRGEDPIRQLGFLKSDTTLSPTVEFEGMDANQSQAAPPDPNGAVNDQYYVQMVNAGGNGSILRVYNLDGTPASPIINTADTFWESVGGQTTGDPIVIWDESAGRWLIAEMSSFGNTGILVAVSQTADPLGGYNVYLFQTPNFPDYHKYAIWPDGYYVTTNETSSPDIPVYILDRAAMIAGAPNPRVVRLLIPKFNETGIFQAATAASWDGTNAPPAGTPMPIVRIYDDSWEGGIDKVELWKASVNWDDPESSSISGPFDMDASAFESNVCNGSIFDCLDQPGDQNLSALQQIIMYRVPYRNFGDYEAIGLNFTVNIDGENQAGVRWMELRKNATNDWSTYQEGTIAPDSLSRFMGSLAFDSKGNMLLAYSVVGAEKPQSLRITGRKVDDPLGMMTYQELEFATGLSAYDGFRWGDYASMAPAPADDRTLWYTGEYMQDGYWSTYVAAFMLERDSLDLGVRRLSAPVNSGLLTDTETISMVVRNYGTSPASNFTVSYAMNGGAFVQEIVTDTLQPDEELTYTFSTTEDLSTIGTYNFILAADLADDELSTNDTIRRSVEQLPRFDIGLAAIEHASLFCDSFGTVSVEFTNRGFENLTSFDYSYQINNGPVVTGSWTGDLPYLNQDMLEIELTDLPSGDIEMSITLADPNGETDYNPGDNQRSTNFTVVQGDQIEVTLELLLDDYPTETTWQIIDDAGTTLFAGGPYETPNALITEVFCLQDSCYTFIIEDSYGDGLSGFSGNGSYALKLSNGVTLVESEEVNFGLIKEEPFCTTPNCGLSLDFRVQGASAPGANNASLRIFVDGGEAPYDFSINGGEDYAATPFFINISAGTYEVIVKDSRNCFTTATIVIPECQIEIETETTPASGAENPDGTITIMADEGSGGYEYSINGMDYQAENSFTGLLPGTYEVYLKDDTGCQISVPIMVGFVVDVAILETGATINMAPNPVSGMLRVEIKNWDDMPAFLPLRVYDANGRVVIQEQLVRYGNRLTNEVPMHALPAGVYFVRLFGEKIDYTGTVIKK